MISLFIYKQIAPAEEKVIEDLKVETSNQASNVRRNSKINVKGKFF